MPIVSTSVSVSGVNSHALTISAAGNYLVTATTFLEAEISYAVGINASIGAVTFNLAGSIVSSLSYFGIYQVGSTDPLTINVMAGGSIFGGGIVFALSQLTLTNYGYLYGEDTGIQAQGAADIVVNRGEIIAVNDYAVSLAGGADVFTNSGHVTGSVSLGTEADRFYGAGGTVSGAIDMGTGNDVLDLRDAQVTGQVSGSYNDDTYVVDATSFDLVELVGQGTDLVKSTVSFELGDQFENLTLMGGADLNGTGNDLNNTLTGNSGDNGLQGGAGLDSLLGGAGDDRLDGDTSADTLSGGIGDDVLLGGAGSDYLKGDAGADTINGGAGRDVMVGDGATFYDDVFVFTRTAHIGLGANSDRISDFHLAEDRIDLSAIDAKAATAGNDAFTLVAAFSNVAGQVTQQILGADTYILGDVTGDGVADFRIVLTGNLVLTSAEFIL